MQFTRFLATVRQSERRDLLLPLSSLSKRSHQHDQLRSQLLLLCAMRQPSRLWWLKPPQTCIFCTFCILFLQLFHLYPAIFLDDHHAICRPSATIHISTARNDSTSFDHALSRTSLIDQRPLCDAIHSRSKGLKIGAFPSHNSITQNAQSSRTWDDWHYDRRFWAQSRNTAA